MLEVIAMFSSLNVKELLRIDSDSIEYSVLSNLDNVYLETENYKLELLEDERSGSEEIQMIFKITDLPYDSNMKFKITDDEIIVDVTKKDINDMIIKGFIDFSLYMKNRNRSLQT